MPYHLYYVETFTPNYFYVGMTGNIKERINSHSIGHGPIFVAKHGAKRFFIKGAFDKIEDAKRAEREHTLKLNFEGKFCAGGGSSGEMHVRQLRRKYKLPDVGPAGAGTGITDYVILS